MTPRIEHLHAAAAPFAAADPAAFFAGAAELPRQQFAVATETACAMFRGFEAIRRIQERAAHDALARHLAAAEKLHGECTPQQMFGLAGDLLRFDFEGAAAYWQQLAAAGMEMQAEMAACFGHLVPSDKVLEATAALDAQH